MKLFLLISVSFLVSTFAQQKCGDQECEKKDYSQTSFVPYAECLDIAADPKAVDMGSVVNSDTCNQNPIVPKLKTFVCQIPDAAVQQEAFELLADFEAGTPTETDVDTIGVCNVTGKTCCNDAYADLISKVLGSWAATQGQRKSKSMTALGDMDDAVEKCGKEGGQGGDGGGQDPNQEDPNQEEPEEGDPNQGAPTRLLNQQEQGQQSEQGEQGQQGEQGNAFQDQLEKQPQNGNGPENIREKMEGHDEVQEQVTGMLQGQVELLKTQVKWLRASMCQLCADPNTIESLYVDGKPKLDKAGVEQYQEDCQKAYNDFYQAEQGAAEAYEKDISEQIEKKGQTNECGSQSGKEEIKGEITDQGINKNADGTERTAVDYCEQSQKLFAEGVLVDESVTPEESETESDDNETESDESDSDEEVTPTRILDTSTEFFSSDDDSVFTSYVSDALDDTLTIDGVDADGNVQEEDGDSSVMMSLSLILLLLATILII